MALKYRDVLVQGLEKLSALMREIQSQPLTLDSKILITRILYISGFLGIQKVTNLFFWLEDYLNVVSPEKLLSFNSEGVLESVIEKSLEILASVEIPDAYGEFVKPSGVTLRPLFSTEVNVVDIFDRLKSWQLINPIRRCIYKLPMAVVSDYSYTLRVPTRYMETHAHDPVYLSLVYLDLTKQEKPWYEYTELFHRLSQEKDLLYQGALEIPYDDLHRKNDVLPYYFLLKSEEPPKAYVWAAGLKGQIMLRLKEPGVPLMNWGTEETALEEDFSADFLDLPPEVSMPKASRTPEEDSGEFVTPQSLHISNAEEPASVENGDVASAGEEPALGGDLDQGGIDPEITPHEKIFRKPRLIQEKLTVIPFTLDDLNRSGHNWPQGLDGVEIQDISTGNSKSQKDEVEEETFFDSDDSGFDSSGSFESDEDEVHTASSQEASRQEMGDTQKFSSKGLKGFTAFLLLLLVLILGGGVWMGESLYRQYQHQESLSAINTLTNISTALENRIVALRLRVESFMTNNNQWSDQKTASDLLSENPEIVNFGIYDDGVLKGFLPFSHDDVLKGLHGEQGLQPASRVVEIEGQTLWVLMAPFSKSFEGSSLRLFLLLDTEILLGTLVESNMLRRLALVNEGVGFQDEKPNLTYFSKPLPLGRVQMVLTDLESVWHWPWESD